jgi:hypothetical protein
MNIFLIAIYILILLILYYICKTEKYDIMCPNGPNETDKNICKEGNGKVYAGSQPLNKDNIAILLSKIKIAGSFTNKEPFWRRSLIGACFSTLLLFIIVFRKFPSISELLGCIMIITTISWIIYGLYNYHHYKHIEENISKSIDLINSKLKL